MARKIAAPKHIYPQLPGGFSVDPNTTSLGDADAVRKQIFETVLDAVHRMPPVENEKYRLVVENPHFADPIDPPDPEQHYEALMNRKTLAARLRGDWVLYDKATNKPVAKRRVTIARIPIMSRLGSFVINGRNYSVINQSRLRPGVYVLAGKAQRVQVNVPPGYGFSYNVEINPKTNKVFVRVGNMKLPFYNFMKTIGAKDEEIKQALGEDIYKANIATSADNKSVESFVRAIAPKTFQFTGNPHEDLRRLVLSTPVDKNVVWRTTGVKGQSLNPQMLLSATKRLLGVLRGEDSGDKRDNLLFQKVYTPADLLAERFLLDSGGVRRNLFKKVVVDGNLEKIRPFALDDYIQQLFFQSGLGQYMEEINPIEIADYRFRVTRMGQGGIPSEDAIPEETRNVHDTHLGFLDPVRTPESGRAGVDLYFASMVRRGKDGELYIPLRNLQRGRVEYVKLADIYDTPIRIPGQPGVHDAVLAAGRIRDRLPSEKPLYELPEFDMSFTVTNNLIPFKMNMKGQRASMSSRMFIQSLPLRNREAPLVRNATPFDKTLSYDEYYGPLVGNLYAPCSGVVKRVDKRRVVVQCDNGKEHRLPLYRLLPFNRKTSFYHTPLVKAGDRVVGNQLLAKSNYSDDSGAVALGTNARVAYVPYEGLNFEDAVVISESFAKKLTSEHMYKEEVELNPEIKLGKKSYLSVFPGKFKREQLEKLDDDGVVKPGMIVYKDDPLILATKLNPIDRTKVHLKGRRSVSSAALTWDHDDPGEVVDVVRTRKGVSVVVKAYRPAQVGDKIVGRYADKGVIAAIIPDSEMIRDEKGRPFDVLMNPMGIPSRGNTGQLLEALLGKVAAKKGEPIVVPDFENYGDAYNWALQIAKENHVKEKEDLVDPKTGRRIKGKVTGVRYILKLQHQSEDKLQGRFTGSYTMSETPGKGGDDGAKRLGLLQTNGLISHGATQFLRDAHLIRGNKNEEFWLRYMMGQDPPVPDVPVVYEKFLAYLHGMGVSLKQREGKFRIMEMTDKDVEKLAGNRKLQNARTVEWGEELKPIPGGLFDPKLTGGHNGRGWTYIELPEPMPNPVMETPMAWLLGIPIADVEKVLACEKELPNGGCGPEAIKQELLKINLDQWIEKYKRLAQTSSKSQLDKVYKILSVLTAAKRKGVHPKEWMITKVPVVPPAYRPVAMLQGSGTPIVNDLNWLYKQLFDVSENLREIKKEGLDVNEDRLAVYRAMKELAGFAEPKSRMLKGMNIKGILRHVIGSTAKEGMVQRELLSTNVDVVGRGVVTPDPRLGMDEIGIPEDTAWEIYRPFVVREMTQSGIPLRQALYDVKEKSDRAKRYLLRVMKHRPVVVSRDPVLHKFGIMGMWPRLTKDKTIHVSPLVVSGYGMDFDGDSCSGDTIVTIDMPSDYVHDEGDISHSTLSDEDMFSSRTALTTATSTRVCKRIRLDEFPRIEESMVTKPSGVQVYKVPPGVCVLSYDAVTGETGFFEVTEFSVHPNCQGYRVTTTGGRVVEVSEDHSLYVFDHHSGDVVSCCPKESVGKLVPVVHSTFHEGVLDQLGHDVVPVKYSVARWMAGVLPTGGTDYTAMIEASHKGYSGRAVFRRAFEKIDSLGVDIPAEVKVWRERFVENEDVIWDVVRKVEKTEVQTMYDITVPETKVFAANDGLVVFDSTNFHVPVSEQARKEVIERMMPSSNLFSTRDYKKVLHRPSREYLLGIYRASQLPSQKQPVRVKNENEAIRLWLSGQLDANDPVEVTG